MQTMNPTWPAPAIDQPPAPMPTPAKPKVSLAAKIVLGVVATVLGLGVIGAIAGDHPTTTMQDKVRVYSDSSYSYNHGDYPNGWTELEVNASARGIASTDLTVDEGACLLRYMIDHYTPSEMNANPGAVGRAAAGPCMN